MHILQIKINQNLENSPLSQGQGKPGRQQDIISLNEQLVAKFCESRDLNGQLQKGLAAQLEEIQKIKRTYGQLYQALSPTSIYLTLYLTDKVSARARGPASGWVSHPPTNSCTDICACICAYICAYICTYICTCICACICGCICTDICAFICATQSVKSKRGPLGAVGRAFVRRFQP